jgi:predicted porin
MKKTLAALAVLGAFAGSALAAEVQLYGILDTGVGYSHIDIDKPDVNDVDSLEMKSGVGSGSRWGLKGTEELGNGLTVGFILEDGFDSDTGSEDSTSVMFNRESSLFRQFRQDRSGSHGSPQQRPILLVQSRHDQRLRNFIR